MADVQIENGYTMIANELLEQFGKLKLSGSQWNILMVAIRQSYGYHRKECDITNQYIAEATGLHKCNVSRELSCLESMGIIRVKKNYGKRSLSLNKNYEQWKFSTKAVIKNDNPEQLSKPITKVIKNDNSKLSKPITENIKNDNHTYKRKHKDNIKENIKYTENFKNDNSSVTKMKNTDFSSEFENLWKLYPKKRGRTAISKKAMKELEKAGYETIRQAIEAYKNEIRRNHTSEQYILNGSTFFNGRWRDYIGDESEVTVDDNPYANVGTNL